MDGECRLAVLAKGAKGVNDDAMTRLLSLALALCVVVQSPAPATAPQFENGLAQPVFANGPIVRHNVWVEVPGLDTDRDGVNDRIRVQIARPDATERGTKLPVILVASPYSGGTRPYPQHDINVPLFVPGSAAMRSNDRARAACSRRAVPTATMPPIRDIAAAGIRPTSCRAASSSRMPTRSAQDTPPDARRSAAAKRTSR